MNFKKCGFAVLGCFLLATGLVAALVPNGLPSILSVIADEDDYNLTINKNSFEVPDAFGEAIYKDNDYSSYTFSSIKSAENPNDIGVLEAGSTIEKTSPANGLKSVNVSFDGGDLFAYTKFETTDTEIKYTLTSGAEQFVTGNYIRFKVGKNNVTLTSLSLSYGCSEEDETEKPTNPLELLPADHDKRHTLRIEAEDATIIDPAGTIVCGVESDKNVNNPSEGKYVYGLNNATAKRTYLTFMFDSNKEGFAVLSFGFGLDSNRALDGMWDVEVNGKNSSIWNSGIRCPKYETVQCYDWTKISGYVIDVKQGINAIKLTLKGTTAPLNFDYIELDSVLSMTLSAKQTYYSTYDANDAAALVSTTATTYSPHSDLVLNKYHGHYGQTGSKTFTYVFSVEEDAVAYLYLAAARNKNLTPAYNLDSTLTVNGYGYTDGVVIYEDYTIPYSLSGGTGGWGDWCEVSFAIINLTAGNNNTISFTFKSSTNFAGISFVATTDVFPPLSSTITQADLPVA